MAAHTLLNGMLAHKRLLDIVENFVLFDESKPGATRKVVARNHQVLGVNQAVESVRRQEALKEEFRPGEPLRHRVVELPLDREERSAKTTKRRKGEATETIGGEVSRTSAVRCDVPGQSVSHPR